MSGLKVAMHTMGCRSNFADTVDLQAALVSAGATPTDFSQDADVYLINSCTVTDSAEKEVRSFIRSIKKSGAQKRIVVTGCLATIGSNVFEELADDDAVIPTGQRASLVAAILGKSNTNFSDKKVSKLNKRNLRHTSEDINEPLGEAIRSPTERLGDLPLRKRFHLRVQEGCDNFCTFCIIPYTRGKIVSRRPEIILDDLRKLNALGYQEVVLTGTHLGGYGIDFGNSLLGLLKEISPNSKCRIRLSSLDPDDISLELIDFISSVPTVCEHLHICLQALDDKILKLMNRGYALERAVKLIEYTRKKLPKAAIGTDLIAGFPGESEESFDEQCASLEYLSLNYAHIFPYSERSGTAATRLNEEVAAPERKRRAGRLRAISERKYREFCRSIVGRELEVVIESVVNSVEKNVDMKFVSGTSREFVEAAAVLDAAADSSKLTLGNCLRMKAISYNEADERLDCELCP